MPMIPYGTVVMSHIPLQQHDTHGDRAILNKGAKGGLILFNQLTKRDVLRRTNKTIGPTVPSQTRPEYDIDVDFAT